MLIWLDRHCLVAWLCLLWLQYCHGIEKDGDIEIIGEIMEWIRSNGGWISDKLEVRQIVGSLSGVFTKEALAEGEMVAEIPWGLIIQPSSSNDEWCEKASELKNVIGKEASELNPYERYLASRSSSHAPFYWSDTSKELLLELFEGISMNGFYESLDDACEGAGSDDKLAQAMMILQTRGEGETIDILVPFGDLMNHQNGNFFNADPTIELGKHSRIFTTRAVQPGEQLQNSYNQCKWCDGLYSNPSDPTVFQVTPQLFEVYGFIEPIPQRWVFREPRLLFDIIYSEEEDADEGELEVDFIVPPSPRGLSFLIQRLHMLDEFKEEHEDRDDIPKQELEGLFQFHEAQWNACALALKHATGEISEQVWDYDEESWQLEHHYVTYHTGDEL